MKILIGDWKTDVRLPIYKMRNEKKEQHYQLQKIKKKK